MTAIPNYSVEGSILVRSDFSLLHGHRLSDGAPVGIKVVELGAGRTTTPARLRHEHRLLRHLDAPGVPHVLAFEAYPGGRALILEPLAGELLTDVCRRGRVSVRTALAIGIALAAALDGMHRGGVIHKGLSPSLILCDLAEASVQLIDFGAASPLVQELGRATLLVRDTVDFAYISPEQTGRMNRTLDTRSDLYSLGVILYEMMAGSVPFARLSEPLALIHAHIARLPTPLREVAPDVPEAVSRIVDKLLAKTAEDRYQTANGLRFDLAQCLDALDRGEAIPMLSLGRHDRDGKLRIPQRLYGREAEVARLLAAFDRSHAGGAELLLISGYSGIGKSVLVREVNKPIAERGGLFISGKFDQFSRNMPYAALGQAFRDLTHLLLCESPASLAGWKTRLQEALGPNGKLLTDMVPDLALIVGPQGDLGSLTPSEVQHRLDITMRRLVRALCGPSHPLVLFLDDLQWIDPASLHLVQALLADGDQKHLLIVGAYRDHEVDATHLLTAALDILRKGGVKLEELTLQPLGSASVVRLLADALDLQTHQVEELADALLRKTQGNPFFLAQFLTELHTEGLLRFDEAALRWSWDMPGIEGRLVADNVVDLVTNKLRRMPVATQQIVTLAAAIGHQFDAMTLATINGSSVADAVGSLWPALEASAVVPIGEDYRFLVRTELGAGEAAEVRADQVWFRFIHDRVQQAAHALTPEERLPGLHLQIGRLLLERHGGYADLPPEALFEVVKHLNRGSALISDPSERLSLARLNLVAGRRAKAAAAYEAAAGLFTAGTVLLAASHWDTEYELAWALHLERGACEHLSGRTDLAERVFERLEPRALTDLDYADLCSLRASLFITESRFSDVVEVCTRGLERLGVSLPPDPESQQAAFMAGVAEVPVNVAGRNIADLVDAPEIVDPRLQRTLALLSLLTPACFYTSLTLFCVGLITHVNLSLKHGHTADSSFGYVSYGFLLIALFDQITVGHEFGRLGLALNERFQNTQLTCQLHIVFANGLHYSRPLREVLEVNRKGYLAGLESGDFNYLGYGSYAATVDRIVLGDDMSAVAADLEQFLRIATRAKVAASVQLQTIARQVIANLQGETTSPGSLSGADFDEVEFRAQLEAEVQPPILCRYYIFKSWIHYLHGDYYNALAEGERAERMLSAIAGLFEGTMHMFTMGLTLVAIARESSAESRSGYPERIARCQDALNRWAVHCPENFAHRAALLRAESADLAGSPEADALYRQAIDAAEQSAFLPDQALANLLAARHVLARGRRSGALPLLLAARRGYGNWGATALVMHLDEQHRSLLFPDSPAQERYISESEPVSLERASDSSFDTLTVFRVAQTLAGEIVLTKLIEQIMRTVMTHAGAQRGALILDRDGRLIIEASITHDPDVVQLDRNEPIEGSEDVAISVVRYVAHTRETVVLGDASHVERFAADRYIVARKPKSLLCLALTHQGRLLGLLYLENNLATNVFSAEQVDLIRMLSAHAAISIQNALLYANVERMTSELRASNAELLSVNQRLQDELSERERAERERAQLQEEVIQFQNARLAELSTPLIPITDKIMVMPIIGTVDQTRATRVVEAALTGAHQSQAAVVILDITGLRHVDTGVIDSLMQTARALRLLGTSVVITGIRPDIAQTLVHLGVDLTAIVTRGTLQSGIAFALERVNDPGALRRRA